MKKNANGHNHCLLSNIIVEKFMKMYKPDCNYRYVVENQYTLYILGVK